jgi:PH (Pleckstrin Homology) domain-containing protein
MRLVAPQSAIPAIAARYLLPHEHHVMRLRQHPARLLPALAMGAGGLLAAVAVNGIAGGVPSARVVVWVLAGFLIARALLDVLVWSFQYIIITERRMILSAGLLGRNVTVIPLQSLRYLAFARSAGGRMLGYGAFTFNADGQARAVIDYIPYPEQLYHEIYGLLYPDEGDNDGGDGDDRTAGFDLDLDDL